jgi:phage gp36-like protein
MAYATLQDLIDRFGELELVQRTDRTNVPPSTIDEAVVEQALEGASSLADGYLRKVYELPLPATPRVLVDKVSDIARYRLRDETSEEKGVVHRNYKDALDWLELVSTGAVALDLGSGPAPAPAGGGAVRSSSGDRTLTQGSMKGYV